MRLWIFVLVWWLLAISIAVGADEKQAWQRHAIDTTSRGADGVRVRDVNGDGRLDFTTGWEEGGVIRVYLHPGNDKVRKPWPMVTVGKVKSPEDAVFVDLDGDGAIDVVSSCEGRTRTMFVHWGPKSADQYLNENAWQTKPIPVTTGAQSWMFALPLGVDGINGPDLIVSSKGSNASVGWLQSPKNPRDLGQWKYFQLYKAGWIMSLLPVDMDSDGDTDVLVSDRRGKNSGVLWLENPGLRNTDSGAQWKEHRVAAANREVMFLDAVDIDGDGNREVLVAVKPADVIIAKQNSDGDWKSTKLALDAASIGTAKSVRAGDIDLDGKVDLVFSCEHASPPKSGIVWLRRTQEGFEQSSWQQTELSGPRGIKFDLLQLLDLDEDGDLDVITCEERHNLGVVWYENPTR